MNFNAFGLKVTLTVALVAGMSAIGSMPAQAASIIANNQRITFTGEARVLDENAADTILDFSPATAADFSGTATTGSTTSIVPGTPFSIQNIKLHKSGNTWAFAGYAGSTVNRWFDLDGIKYDLTVFNLIKDVANNNFSATIQGLFDGGLTTKRGSFSSQEDLFIDGTTFSAQVVATSTTIPTPALLPGLVGLGAAAWRKRQSKLVAA
jgi:hypothetical protein